MTEAHHPSRAPSLETIGMSKSFGALKALQDVSIIQHVGRTKLRAIASVLNQETADRWIEIASSHSKAEVVKLVREYSLQSSKQNHGAQPDTQVKTFRLQDSQSQCIRAAIDKVKKFNATDRDSAALEAIC